MRFINSINKQALKKFNRSNQQNHMPATWSLLQLIKVIKQLIKSQYSFDQRFNIDD